MSSSLEKTMPSEFDSLNKDIELLPDGPEKKEAFGALTDMQRDAALINRIKETMRASDHSLDASLRREGIAGVFLAIGLLVGAIIALETHPNIEVTALSLLAIFLGLTFAYQGAFVLIKKRICNKIATPRDWQSSSLIQAIRDWKPLQTTNVLPVWGKGKSDQRITTRAFNYEPIVQALVAEAIASIPATWNSCRVIIDCDALSIRCRIAGGDKAQRIDATPALISLGAQLFARMGMAGDEWRVCTIVSTKSAGRTWYFQTNFKFVAAFPTPRHITPRSITNDEMERILPVPDTKSSPLPFRGYAVLLCILLLGLGVFVIGWLGWSDGSVRISPKNMPSYIATPIGENAFSYYFYVFGFMAFGLFMFVLAFWFGWLALFSLSPQRAAVITALSQPIRPSSRGSIPLWFFWGVVILVLALFLVAIVSVT